MTAIAVRDLRKSYGAVEAVRGIAFDVQRGEVFGLLGPNGVGKTTTVEILEGYRKRDGGEVEVLGTDPATARGDWRERIGVVLQSSASPRASVKTASGFPANGVSVKTSATRYRKVRTIRRLCCPPCSW